MLDAMKVPYRNRTPLATLCPMSVLKDATVQFVRSYHAFQKLRYGRVRVRLSTANLLR